jgi:trimeric autotransporter adhesin
VSIINKVSNKTLMPGITPIADVPDAPTIGAATNVGTSRAYNNGSATVAYTAAATGGAVTTFTATSTPGSFTATGASPITVTGLQSATSYTFTVSAANANGTLTSAASSSITATTVPQAPTIGTATLSGTSASVTFTAGATGGSTVTGYTVTSSTGSLTGTGASSPITVSGLSYNTAYTFTVTATNANGTSAASSASNSVTPAIPYWLSLIDSPNGITNNSSQLNAVGTSDSVVIHGVTYNAGFTNVGFLTKLNLDGTLSWSKDTAAAAYINGAKVAASGNIYITGWTGGTPVGHITKVNSAGVIQWTRALSYSGGNVVPYAIAIDSSENVHIAGMGRHSSTTYAVGFVAKYDTSGTLQWQRSVYDTADTTYFKAIAVDSSGNVFVGGKARASGSSIGYVLAKYNSSGTIQWKNRGYTGSNQEQITTLTCDSSGNVYVGGDAGSGATVFFGKFDTNGTNSWIKQFNYDGNGNNLCTTVGVGVDSSGNITFGAQVDRDGVGPHASITKYNSSGTLQLSRTFGVLNTSSTGMVGFGVGSDDTFYAITNGRYIWHLPNDGTKTGTYSSGTGPSMVYGNGFTQSTSTTLGNFGTSTLQTDAAGQHTDAAGSLSFTTSVITITKTAIV